MQRYIDNNLLSGISSAVLSRPRSRRRQLRRLGRQGGADAAARRPYLSRLLQHQADHLLRGAAAVRGRQARARRSDRAIHSAIRQSKGLASRRNIARRHRAGEELDHHPPVAQPQFRAELWLLRSRHRHLQGAQRARRAQSHDDAGRDGRRAGRHAADLSSGHVVGIFARDRCDGAAGRGHQRPDASTSSSRRAFSIRSAWSIPASSCRRRITAASSRYYAGADMMAPMKPGLTRTDNSPFPGAYLRPIPRLSGGGGLVSTMPDMVALIRSLLPGGRDAAEARNDRADDDQPVAGGPVDPLCHCWANSRARRTDLPAA